MRIKYGVVRKLIFRRKTKRLVNVNEVGFQCGPRHVRSCKGQSVCMLVLSTLSPQGARDRVSAGAVLTRVARRGPWDLSPGASWRASPLELPTASPEPSGVSWSLLEPPEASQSLPGASLEPSGASLEPPKGKLCCNLCRNCLNPSNIMISVISIEMQ